MPNRNLNTVNLVRFVARFSIAEEFLKRKDWVKYKTIPEWHLKAVDDYIMTVPSKEFASFVEDHVNAYILDKKLPPKDIATAVINLADDFLNGQEFVMRSGDYISLMNDFRAHK